MKKRLKIKKSTDKYYNLDLARYLSSVLIVVLHLGPFDKRSPFATFLLNNTIARICVPLFFIITGYFVVKKEEEDPNYIYKYIKTLLPMYLFWSLLYVPQGFAYVKDMGLHPSLYPLAIFVGLFYIGTYYHLWYFPALIMALLSLKFLKKYISVAKLLVISFVLLLIGSFETYYGVLPIFLKNIMDLYFEYFFTTRNFLFFGIFYITLGYYLGQKNDKRIKHSFSKTLLFLVVFILEIYVIKGIKRMDSNILISAVPLSYYAFTTFLHTKKLPFFEFKHSLRKLYTYYYLVHPLVFLLLNSVIPEVYRFGEESYRIAFIKIIFALIIVHIISVLILELKDRYKKLPI